MNNILSTSNPEQLSEYRRELNKVIAQVTYSCRQKEIKELLFTLEEIIKLQTELTCQQAIVVGMLEKLTEQERKYNNAKI